MAAFARKGALSDLLSILASFLTNRTMSVRVGNDWSASCLVYGGVPQGSILGVMLFNITTDNLDDVEDETAVEVHHDVQIHSPSGCWSPQATSTTGKISSDGDDLSLITLRGGDDFFFLPTARNNQRNLDRLNGLGEQERITEEPPSRTSAKWVQEPEKLFKCVDDHVQVLKINMETADEVPGERRKKKHAVISQNTFSRVLAKATS